MRRADQRRRDARGAVAVIVAIALVVLLGFLALVLNIGHNRAVRAQLQNAADSAAIAGAMELDGTLARIQALAPHTWAADFSARHITDRDTPVQIEPSVDVVVGHWDPFTTDPDNAFTPMWPTTAEEARGVNAVLVRTGREAERGNAVPVWLGAFLGGATAMNVRAEAVAVNGGPCIDCPDVPLAFFDCAFMDPATYELECGAHPRMTMTAEFAPDPDDTVGFTSLGPDPASTTTYREILACGEADCLAPGCDVYRAGAGDPINISNGNQLSALCADFDRYCTVDPLTALCTAPIPIRAPVVHGECPPKFNQAHPIVGYATFNILKLECKGASKYMEFEFLCNAPPSDADRIGCGFLGTGPKKPKLVR